MPTLIRSIQPTPPPPEIIPDSWQVEKVSSAVAIILGVGALLAGIKRFIDCYSRYLIMVQKVESIEENVNNIMQVVREIQIGVALVNQTTRDLQSRMEKIQLITDQHSVILSSHEGVVDKIEKDMSGIRADVSSIQKQLNKQYVLEQELERHQEEIKAILLKLETLESCQP